MNLTSAAGIQPSSSILALIDERGGARRLRLVERRGDAGPDDVSRYGAASTRVVAG
ncbi:hypothetical protein [Sorangium sp. So ce1078]|uniref:hypothetical protein n=1 Tax=Sorangium sp. So ce1078 TaxID=3133329 RepID=UPI003F5DB011